VRHLLLLSILLAVFVSRVAFSPILSEAAGAGGSEDGLAEAFEDGGDFVEAFRAGIDFLQELFQFYHDAALFV